MAPAKKLPDAAGFIKKRTTIAIVKTEILYGIHAVQEAIRARRRTVFKLHISEKKASNRVQELISLAESQNIPIETHHTDTLRQILMADHHQGIGAEVSCYPLSPFPHILESLHVDGLLPMVLILDQIVDPQNLGALIRTALSVGIQAMFIPKDRSALPTPSVSRASAGALEHVRVSKVTNVVSTIKVLKQKGFWVVGLDKTSEVSIFSADLKCPLALIIGGEEKGMRPLVKKHCDVLVSIPQNDKIDSLNASVAGAVAMYEAFRQRETI